MDTVAVESASHFKWHTVFTWLPIAVDGQRVWLKKVERRCTNVFRLECARHGHSFIYRLPRPK